ncbi:flagellin [Parvularcula sp. LCG005]|uniref:flagellin n=1 Tax=Parvularcula sp. LCG005 TaxID=3078805 RepID=UPI0029435D6A|nr:flagellin [Parvularcula sp. LCG005]WOI52949.1 flagellin [Parvularcula sp. LCG005]
MSSINFNQSAIVALDTLRDINMNLQKTQNLISTGKKVATARDNAAVWAISTVMTTDVASFKAITDSLNLGAATVGVARSASEQVTKLIQEMKSLIVSAQEENVDRDKIQRDVDALYSQVTDIVDAAQFNGLNLLKGSDDVQLLSSLNRADGAVSPDRITINRVDLTSELGTAGATISSAPGEVTTNPTGSIDGAGTANLDVTFTAGQLTVGDTLEISLTSGGQTYTFTEVASAGDTTADVVARIQTQVDEATIFPANITIATTTVGDDSTDTVVNIAASGTTTATFTATADTGAVGVGGLAGLATLDVTTTAGAQAALDAVELALDTAVDAAASFGSAQMRIDIQNDFVQSLIDSMEAGISALTDANLEEASARLQSLQVQQQLNIQALTIANQSPQAILALFR